MPRFLHTADWQIGKPYRSIQDTQKRFRTQYERVQAIKRVAEIADKENVDSLLVAGDLFDSNTVPTELVMEVLEIIGEMNKKVYTIPGNHDHGGSGGIWERKDVQKELRRRAPLMELLNERTPSEKEQFTLLPCPLKRQRETVDPTAWIKRIDWESIDKNKPRIVLAHGSVVGFSGSDYDSIGNNNLQVNEIDLKGIPLNEVDYIALGDWHNLKKIGEKAYYPGTPEQDRFSQNKLDQRDQVLIVEIERGENPKITPIQTGGLKWHNISMELRSSENIDLLEMNLKKMLNNRVGRDLLRIELNGQLSLGEYSRLNSIIEDITKQLLYIRVKGEVRKCPGRQELTELTERIEDPIISEVASSLYKEIERVKLEQKETLENNEELKILEIALCELHRLSQESNE